ncbi:acyltransferase [Rhodanobacter sp. B2A1Ga4]|uniref:acyltransferase family protein n=1 Tax=Rhodanobacter sp. B2A1Ga4 TaxID=2778647 RepID=UPI001B390678|nr:acyltransferase family protein [Rhodanobacter sp. B2A1Ga4]MBQ4855961.1 acyltransferase [Rhodanobacter sp. B2A1Ga4]
MDAGRPPLRSDIQALRGLAVLLVILQHARAGFIGAGWLGVDIFFVISGFLITGLLARDIGQGRFRFATFYFRRAKRLLPAAYVTFAVTAAAAFFLLDASEWQDFTRQLAGAVSFTGNFVLLQQTGYFAGTAALKPLLHVWSLAVEEQYYLLLPAALLLVPRRWWFAGSVLVLAASFALCVVLSYSRPEAAFYLLPTRAWELAIGSLAALAGAPGPRRQAWVARLFLPALAALFVVPVWPLPAPHFANIAIVCVATLVVIMRRHPELQDRPLPNVLAAVGDASYSLYLVHWPVFALLNNVYAGDPSFGTPAPAVLAGAVALALLLGFALYRGVERPLRRLELHSPGRWSLAALAASLGLALLPLTLAARSGTHALRGPAIDYAWLRRDNVGFDAVCDGYQRLEYTMRCSNAAHPATMIWGDSFAMHLVPGLAATMPGGVLQATKSACGPLLGLAQIYRVYTREFAERCLSFNDSVIAYLAAHPEIRTVVLSSPFYEYFDPARRMLHVVDGQARVEPPDADTALAALAATIGRVRALGRRVVIVAPPPGDGFDYSHCLERKARNRTLFGRFIDCDIPLAQYRASKRRVFAFLQRIHAQADVEVVSFDAFLCDTKACRTELDGTFLYRDDGHLSYDGSLLLARRMHLDALIAKAAR